MVRFIKSSVLCVAGLITLGTLVSCQGPPGGGSSSPRCIGGNFWSGAVDTNGDGNPDSLGLGWEWHFIACSTPGTDVGAGLHTHVVNGTRTFQLTVTAGPETGTDYEIKDVFDAISAMDQIFKASDYDMTFTATSNYRAELKGWIVNNWMSPSAFHTETGY